MVLEKREIASEICEIIRTNNLSSEKRVLLYRKILEIIDGADIDYTALKEKLNNINISQKYLKKEILKDTEGVVSSFLESIGFSISKAEGIKKPELEEVVQENTTVIEKNRSNYEEHEEELNRYAVNRSGKKLTPTWKIAKQGIDLKEWTKDIEKNRGKPKVFNKYD